LASSTRDGHAVFLSGPIEAKDLKTFHDAVGNDEKLTVYLSSSGGEVHPATMIGVLIRDRKLATRPTAPKHAFQKEGFTPRSRPIRAASRPAGH